MLCSTKIRVVKEIEELSKEEMLLYSTAALAKQCTALLC